MRSAVAQFTRIALGCGLAITTWSAAMAQDQNAMMTPPPPMTDSTLLNWVGGTWGGDLTMGDQKLYGEGQFTLGVSQQWIQGDVAVWTDKTKATELPMGFKMYIRPGAAAGSYKAVQITGDGSFGTATVTKSGENLNFSWTHDNGIKETGTLSKMDKDHVVYKASMADAAGNKIMEFQHDMHRTRVK